MKAEDIKKWSGALRSGEYKQGLCQLRDQNDAMCCLGVMIDVLCPEQWTDIHGAWLDRGDGGQYQQGGTPTIYTTELVGFPNDRVLDFVSMNDFDKKTFAEIADEVDALVPTE